MMKWFLETGGIMIWRFRWPLLLCSVLTLAIIAEKTGQFLFHRISPLRLEKLRAGRKGFPSIENLSPKDPVRKFLTFSSGEVEVSSAEQEEILNLKGEVHLQELRRRLPLLSLIGRISPMLGLSGTVLGLADTFRKISENSSRTPDLGLLAGGIWEAMLTTIVGLFIGITAIVAHHLLESVIERYGFELRMLAEIFLRSGRVKK